MKPYPPELVRKENRYKKAWEWPDCPECNSAVFVDGCSPNQNLKNCYTCWACKIRFKLTNSSGRKVVDENVGGMHDNRTKSRI